MGKHFSENRESPCGCLTAHGNAAKLLVFHKLAAQFLVQNLRFPLRLAADPLESERDHSARPSLKMTTFPYAIFSGTQQL